MNTVVYKGFTIVSKGFFAVMPLTMSQMVYDMSNGSGQAKPKATLSVAGKTYSEEELEYMAAMRVADSFNLPNAELLAFAAKNPPPLEWFGTPEDKPF